MGILFRSTVLCHFSQKGNLLMGFCIIVCSSPVLVLYANATMKILEGAMSYRIIKIYMRNLQDWKSMLEYVQNWTQDILKNCE